MVITITVKPERVDLIPNVEVRLGVVTIMKVILVLIEGTALEIR